VELAKRAEDMGAGEIILNSMDRDGTMQGYDLKTIEIVSRAVGIPVVALGEASCVPDFKEAISSGASAVAAGSMFVFYGPHRAVLINVPSASEIQEAFS
jgi:cyclase